MKKLFFLSVTLLLLGQISALNLLADTDVPADTSWSSLDLDTTGETRDLLPTYPIPYSAKWATADYDRTFSMSAESTALANPYEIETFGQEEEGTYQWNYTEVSAEDLPRGAEYTLAYTIKQGETVVDTQDSVASVTLLPEPCFALVLTILGLAILRRK